MHRREGGDEDPGGRHLLLFFDRDGRGFPTMMGKIPKPPPSCWQMAGLLCRSRTSLREARLSSRLVLCPDYWNVRQGRPVPNIT